MTGLHYIYNQNGRITTVSAKVGSLLKTIREYEYNSLGEITDITDHENFTGTGTNTVEIAYSYDEFGQTTVDGNYTFSNEICYTGGIYDWSTGQYYLNARYYDPETGRFLSEDTYRGDVNEPNTLHLYAYCANNPVNYVDPSGHVFYGFWSETQHYFVFNQNAPQRYLGYYDAYDHLAFLVGADIGHKKFETKKWKIEFWKGIYGKMYGYAPSNGCEIGLYYKAGSMWKCAYQKERRIRMRMTLYRRGDSKKLFTRDSKYSTVQGKSWWLTAFKPSPWLQGGKVKDTEDLKMTGTLWFGSSSSHRSELKDLSLAMGNKSYRTEWGDFKLNSSSNWEKRTFTWEYKQ